MSSQKLIYEVTVSVSSSRLFVAASKTLQSVRLRQACTIRSVSLVHLFTVFYHRFSRFQFLPVGWYKRNQAVIREPQSCLWSRVICILYCCITVIQYITVSGGTCNMLSVFWQFTGDICFIRRLAVDEEHF